MHEHYTLLLSMVSRIEIPSYITMELGFTKQAGGAINNPVVGV
jgi:hypothetical protein